MNESEPKRITALKITAFVLAGIGIGVNLIGIILYWQKDMFFDVLIHSALILLGAIVIIAVAFYKGRRLLSPAALILITTVVALVYRSFPDPSQDAAAIFGISAFIWLVLEKLFKN